MWTQKRIWFIGIVAALLVVTSGQTTVAQARSLWTATYWENVGQEGVPAKTRYEETINYDWGKRAPLPGIPADYFSVRWVKTVRLTAATYHLSVRADDGVRVTVNGETVIDDYVTHALRARSADIVLNSGEHEIIVDYFEWTGRAAVQFDLKRTDKPVDPIVIGRGGPDTATVTGVRWLLDVHERPGNIASQIVGRVANGEEVVMLERRSQSARYVQIELASGAQGWMHRDFLSTVADMTAYEPFSESADGPWGALPYRNLYATVVVTAELPAYAQPGDTTSDQVGSFQRGELVALTGFQSSSGMYVQVKLPAEQQGWVFGSFLDGQIALYSLAVYNP